MFRELRRKRQALDKNDCIKILENGVVGVLALDGDDNYPYAVPINYVFDGENIYFHSAKAGHKLDAIQRNPKVSFCVIAQDDVIPEEYTSYFRSVIAFGKIEILEDEQAKWKAIEKLAIKYHPMDTVSNRHAAIQKDWKPLCMLKMTINHLSGKQSIELV